MMQSILARTHLIYNDKDVVQPLTKLSVIIQFMSLSRFLRESFFERVSLRPSEVLSVLPPNLIYLGGDGMLRENFHVLCNHGIPRSKIEKDV